MEKFREKIIAVVLLAAPLMLGCQSADIVSPLWDYTVEEAETGGQIELSGYADSGRETVYGAVRQICENMLESKEEKTGGRGRKEEDILYRIVVEEPEEGKVLHTIAITEDEALVDGERRALKEEDLSGIKCLFEAKRIKTLLVTREGSVERIVLYGTVPRDFSAIYKTLLLMEDMEEPAAVPSGGAKKYMVEFVKTAPAATDSVKTEDSGKMILTEGKTSARLWDFINTLYEERRVTQVY